MSEEERVARRRIHYRAERAYKGRKRDKTPRPERFKLGGTVTVHLRRFGGNGDVVATGTGKLENVSKSGIAVRVTFPERTTVGVRDRFDIEVSGGVLRGLVIGGRLKHEMRINGATCYGLQLFGASKDDQDILARGVRALRNRARLARARAKAKKK